MEISNMMTCSNGLKGFTCSLVWIAFAITTFLCLIVRRQCEDGVLSGVGYNIYGAFILGLGGVIFTAALTASPQWCLLAGIVGLAVGGFGGGLIMNTTDEGGGDY